MNTGKIPRNNSKKQGLDVQVHMYDQLGSWYSDTPDWDNPEVASQIQTYDYYVDEIEEVRQKLGIDQFYLIGQSWGGALVQLYAAKYGQHLKGAIISSMVDRISDYTDHLNQIRKTALSPTELEYMQQCEANNDYDNDRYQQLVEKLNDAYVDRKKPAAIAHLVNTMSVPLYNAFQGDNEFVITGKLGEWNFTDHLKDIKVPTLVTFGEHETMPLATGRRMAEMIPNAQFVSTPEGGHHHMIDNAPVYYQHLANFLQSVEAGTFNQK